MLLITVCPGAKTTLDRSSRLSDRTVSWFLHYWPHNRTKWLDVQRGCIADVAFMFTAYGAMDAFYAKDKNTLERIQHRFAKLIHGLQRLT